jgi:hypothetical protein
MAQFDMIANPPKELIPQGEVINNSYFTIDTADLSIVNTWLDYNPYILTHALLDGTVHGFFNIIPISTETAELFDRQALKEEDLNTSHMLMHEALPHAKYAYLAAIAVKDYHSYLSHQCVAAMMSAIASLFLRGYSPLKLQRLYANPTTFKGNMMVRKLGLKPSVAIKKPLKGNDIYTLDFTPEIFAHLEMLEKRYARFVGKNDWR